MNIFNQIKQFLYSLVDGRSCDIDKNISDTKSNQDLLEEIQERIRELQRREVYSTYQEQSRREER